MRSMIWLASGTNDHHTPITSVQGTSRLITSVRYFLAARLNWLTRHLSSVVSQPAFCIVVDLLVATAAGCAGKDSASNLTAATQGRALLAMRSGCVLPGAVTTAPAQEVSSVVAIERIISEIESAHLAARHGNKRTSVGAGAH